jgi:hypothetical protein
MPSKWRRFEVLIPLQSNDGQEILEELLGEFATTLNVPVVPPLSPLSVAESKSPRAKKKRNANEHRPLGENGRCFASMTGEGGAFHTFSTKAMAAGGVIGTPSMFNTAAVNWSVYLPLGNDGSKMKSAVVLVAGSSTVTVSCLVTSVVPCSRW